MSSHASDHTGHAPPGTPGHGPHHPASFYVKIWGVLVGLLIVSVIGPEFGIFWLTMVTAFGIAVVKAYLVAAHFMHLKSERVIASMIIVTSLALMVVFFMAVSPDVMKHEGDQWVNAAAKAEIARRLEREGQPGENKAHDAHAPAAAEEH